ncbi:MAG: hypothetical protein K2W95_12925 [Candidatus Obscuribacterales bacterium]|nr:hypothetical protein [Candidatus Obscuribacterales bacterium]
MHAYTNFAETLDTSCGITRTFLLSVENIAEQTDTVKSVPVEDYNESSGSNK